MKIIFLLLITIFFQLATAVTAESIDFIWDWAPNNSGYTSGPDGDVAYDLYMKTEDNPDYSYDYPLVGGIDNCWLNNDRYRCRTTVDHDFNSGVYHHFVVVAYLIDDPDQKSLSSNEVTYYVDSADGNPPVSVTSGGNSGGGGCFFDELVKIIVMD